jgi:SAM-dependent methyltransferase
MSQRFESSHEPFAADLPKSMSSYQPKEFWESAHSKVPADKVEAGLGVRNVGGGRSSLEAAAFYRARETNMHRLLRKAQLPLQPRILELGSGGGYWADFFSAFKPASFVGADISSTAVSRLQQTYPNYLFYCLQDSGAWSQIEKQQPFDLCLAIDVLYHITDDATWRANLTKLCQLCETGGYLIIADYFYQEPIDQPSKIHVRFRGMQDYLDVLDRHGFRVEHIQPVFYFLNRTISGPWRDHNRLASPILRLLTSNILGLSLLGLADATATKFTRPMNPKCRTRFLLARKESASSQP